MFYHSKNNSYVGPRVEGYCDRPDYADLGKIVKGLWNLVQEKPLSIHWWALCRSLEDKDVVEDTGAEGGLPGSWSLRGLRTLWHHFVNVELRLWFCLAGAEESTVINKIPEPLK